MKTQNLIFNQRCHYQSVVNFGRSGIPAGELGVSLAFFPSRCVATRKMGNPSGGSEVADVSSWACTGGLLVFSCVTPSGRQCCHCDSLLIEIRHLLQVRLMCFLFCWWIFNWTQIIAFHSNTSFTEDNVRVIIVCFFTVGHGAYIHVQLSWEFLPTHLWFISVALGQHLSWALGDYIPITFLFSPLLYVHLLQLIPSAATGCDVHSNGSC